MIIALFFVIFPLALYVPLLLIEMNLSLLSVSQKRSFGEYMHITWETTHTLLILSVVAFVWLFNDAVPIVAPVVALPLLLAALCFVLRAAAYIIVYYEWGTQALQQFASQFFALTHLVLLAGLLWVIYGVATTVPWSTVVVQSSLIIYLWPGLIATVVIVAIPVVDMYKKLFKE
jgi:hypothetical protein